LARGHAGVQQLPAIRGAQIEMHARRRRHVSGRHHREPRQWIRLFAPREPLERAVEPFGGGWELSGKCGGNIGTDFVAAAADGRAERRNDVFCARAEFHAHAAKRFLRDARQRSAPAGVDCGNGTVFRVGEKNRHAVGGLYGKQEMRCVGEQRVATQRLDRCIGRGRKCGANQIGVELPKRGERPIARSGSRQKLLAIGRDGRARIPFGVTKIQRGLAIQLARAADARAERMREPGNFAERGDMQNAQASGAPQRPIGISRS